MDRKEIPKLIWQTSHSMDSLGIAEIACVRSWSRKNPDWEYHFCCDDLGGALVEEFHDPPVAEIFRRLTPGEMKAGFLRFLLLAEFGGFYSGIDTFCRHPLDSWLTGSSDLHVACENDGVKFGCTSIAAPPGHPLLIRTVELMISRFQGCPANQLSSPLSSSFLTGADLWTTAIQDHLGTSAEAMTIFTEESRFRDTGIIIHPSYFFDGIHVKHLSETDLRMLERRLRREPTPTSGSGH